MASMNRTAIGASASGFETDVLSLEGVGKQRGGGMSIYQLPSFFGAVLGRDVIDSAEWRIGFTITKPTSWNQEIVGGIQGDTRVSYSSHVGLSTLLPTFSASYSPFPSLRFGAGLGVAITSLSQVQSLSEQVSTATTADAFLRNADASGSVWNLTGTLGAQWDISEHLVLGGMIRLPGLKLIQSGQLAYQSVENQATPWNNTYFNDQDATFDYKLPFDVNVGLAWRSRSFEVEADVRFHAAIGEYMLFTSEKPVLVTTTDPTTGRPVYTSQPFQGITERRQGRLELRPGRALQPRRDVELPRRVLHRRLSHERVRGEGLPQRRHVRHHRGGEGPRRPPLRVPRARLRLGELPAVRLRRLGQRRPITTQLSVTSLSLLYAVAYKF